MGPDSDCICCHYPGAEDYVFYIFLDPSAKGLAEEVRRATRAENLDYQVFLRDAENDVALGISRVQKVLSFDIMTTSPKQEYAVSEFGTYEYDKEAYDGDARTGIANSGFYQAFEEWVESNNMNDILPELDGHDATRVDVLQSGYLFSAEADLRRYQMICRLIYK